MVNCSYLLSVPCTAPCLLGPKLGEISAILEECPRSEASEGCGPNSPGFQQKDPKGSLPTKCE